MAIFFEKLNIFCNYTYTYPINSTRTFCLRMVTFENTVHDLDLSLNSCLIKLAKKKVVINVIITCGVEFCFGKKRRN